MLEFVTRDVSLADQEHNDNLRKIN